MAKASKHISCNIEIQENCQFLNINDNINGVLKLGKAKSPLESVEFSYKLIGKIMTQKTERYPLLDKISKLQKEFNLFQQANDIKLEKNTYNSEDIIPFSIQLEPDYQSQVLSSYYGEYVAIKYILILRFTFKKRKVYKFVEASKDIFFENIEQIPQDIQSKQVPQTIILSSNNPTTDVTAEVIFENTN